MRKMYAKFDGRCVVCRGLIKAGDMIAWYGPKRSAHPVCAGRANESKPADMPAPDRGPKPTPASPACSEAERIPAHLVGRYTIDDGVVFSRWTVSDLIDLVRTSPPHPVNRDIWSRMIVHHDRRWHGSSYDEALTAVSWPQGASLVQKYDANFDVLPARDVRRVRRWSEDGDEFSRDVFDSGRADCWSSMRRSAGGVGPGVIRLTVHVGGNSNIDAVDLAWSGAAAVKLVDTLESAGYRVQVDALSYVHNCYVTGPHREFVSIVECKGADEPVDIDRLAMALASPWFFRWHMFRMFLGYPGAASTNGIGVQASACTGPAAKHKGDIHIAQVRSMREAQQTVDRELARYCNQASEEAA